MRILILNPDRGEGSLDGQILCELLRERGCDCRIQTVTKAGKVSKETADVVLIAGSFKEGPEIARQMMKEKEDILVFFLLHQDDPREEMRKLARENPAQIFPLGRETQGYYPTIAEKIATIRGKEAPKSSGGPER